MSADNHNSTQDLDDQDDVAMRRCLGKLYKKSPSHPIWGDNSDDRFYMPVAYERTDDTYHYHPDKPRRMYIMKCLSSDGELLRWATSARSFVGDFFIEVKQP